MSWCNITNVQMWYKHNQDIWTIYVCILLPLPSKLLTQYVLIHSNTFICHIKYKFVIFAKFVKYYQVIWVLIIHWKLGQTVRGIINFVKCKSGIIINYHIFILQRLYKVCYHVIRLALVTNFFSKTRCANVTLTLGHIKVLSFDDSSVYHFWPIWCIHVIL